MSLLKGTSDLLEGLREVFRGFVLPRNSVLINWYRYLDFLLFLHQQRQETVDDSAEASEQTSPIVCLQNLLPKHVMETSEQS